MTTITEPAQFDISKLKIKNEVNTLKSGIKKAYVNYNGRASLYLETPFMHCPFGIKEETNEGETKYKLELSFRDEESDPSVAEFRAILDAMDQLAEKTALENTLTYFKKNHPLVLIKEFHKPCVRIQKESKYAPTFRLNLPFREGAFDMKVYDTNKNKVDMLELVRTNTKGASVTAIIQCTGFWMSGAGFGYTWKVHQMMIRQSVNSIPEFAFKNWENKKAAAHNDDEEEVEEQPNANIKATKAPTTTYVSDSEEEEEEEEKPAPAKAKAVEEVSSKPPAAPAKAKEAVAPAAASVAEDDDEEEEPVMSRTFTKPVARKSKK